MKIELSSTVVTFSVMSVKNLPINLLIVPWFDNNKPEKALDA
jgi:hypothetical protein